MGIGSDNSGAGVHTIIFALKTILYNTEQRQKVITPEVFGKTMKGYNIHDYRKSLTGQELRRYKNQLLNAYDFWDDSEWKCEMKKGSSFRLIFTRMDETDEGKR